MPFDPEPAPGAYASRASLTVRRCAVGPIEVVALVGEFDIATHAVAERAVAEAEEASPETLLLDLSGLRFVDSTGVRLVLAADARAREAGRRCTIVLGDGRPRRLFEVLGLIDRLDIAKAGPVV